jgi:hypothetical protein
MVLDLYASLPRVKVSSDGPYNYIDRARDFLATFDSESGKRVLAQIAQICDPPPLMSEADKDGTLAFKSGVRWVMTQIMICMAARPPITMETTNEHHGERA